MMFVRRRRNINNIVSNGAACFICGDPWINSDINNYELWWYTNNNCCRPVFCDKCVT
ncbi:Clas63 [Clostera anastomosis granulovirus B]|uniref:Clas63 n=1 Tax=Clostera anastomosis granulovirus B TaxID=1986290 RepID=A0A0K0WS85_9BBAC|nr:Clas63 [Clostera anastomosis granulovirus B]AKS25406.1 Clas63 [Clostera anastomosis granulovirus B]